jgi:hypothetical protein
MGLSGWSGVIAHRRARSPVDWRPVTRGGKVVDVAQQVDRYGLICRYDDEFVIMKIL